MNLIDDELSAIEARAEAATRGPLEDGWDTVRTADGEWVIEYNRRTDGALFLHARSDVLALVAEVRRLREIVGSLLVEAPLVKPDGWRGLAWGRICGYCESNVGDAVLTVDMDDEERRELGLDHEPDCPWRQAREYMDGVSAAESER